MNQLRCKQLKGTVVRGFKPFPTDFFTVTVEKAVSLQAETIVQLRTSSVGHWTWRKYASKALSHLPERDDNTERVRTITGSFCWNWNEP
jgi:hypothetical protein